MIVAPGQDQADLNGLDVRLDSFGKAMKILKRALSYLREPSIQLASLTRPQHERELLDEYTDAQVAEQLNQQGYRTFDGLLFQSMHVCQLRRHHGLLDRHARLRAQGLLTAEELAQRHGVTAQTIWRWYRQGRIMGICYNDRRSCLFPPQEVDQQRPTELK